MIDFPRRVQISFRIPLEIHEVAKVQSTPNGSLLLAVATVLAVGSLQQVIWTRWIVFPNSEMIQSLENFLPRSHGGKATSAIGKDNLRQARKAIASLFGEEFLNRLTRDIADLKQPLDMD